MLDKDFESRISLEKILKHPWLTKKDQNISELRRKSTEFNQEMIFQAFTMTDSAGANEDGQSSDGDTPNLES